MRIFGIVLVHVRLASVSRPAHHRAGSGPRRALVCQRVRFLTCCCVDLGGQARWAAEASDARLFQAPDSGRCVGSLV
eukprot:7711716-Alexandrium_andersonii.AAC.1